MKKFRIIQKNTGEYYVQTKFLWFWYNLTIETEYCGYGEVYCRTYTRSLSEAINVMNDYINQILDERLYKENLKKKPKTTVIKEVSI